jgi:arginine exporter protein ArgO
VYWREETVVNYRTVKWVGIAFLVLWALTVLRQATAPTERG